MFYRIDFNTLRDLWEKEIGKNVNATKEEEEDAVKEELDEMNDMPNKDGDTKE